MLFSFFTLCTKHTSSGFPFFSRDAQLGILTLYPAAVVNVVVVVVADVVVVVVVVVVVIVVVIIVIVVVVNRRYHANTPKCE